MASVLALTAAYAWGLDFFFWTQAWGLDWIVIALHAAVPLQLGLHAKSGATCKDSYYYSLSVRETCGARLMGTRVPVWSLRRHSCARAAFTPWSARADTQVYPSAVSSVPANSDTQSKPGQRRAPPLALLLFILFYQQ